MLAEAGVGTQQAPQALPAAAPIGIAAAAVRRPGGRRAVAEILAAEGAQWTPEATALLGIEEVAAAAGERGSELVLAAAAEALASAGIDPAELDLIIDSTILPQELQAPVWSMSSKLQGELAAGGALTLGFSGGGPANFLVSLAAALSFLQSEDDLRTALLIGADLSIPGSRAVNPGQPITVLGDAAYALVLRRGEERATVRAVELASDGALHDVAYVAGGGMAYPDRFDLYRYSVDLARFEEARRRPLLGEVAGSALERSGLGWDAVDHLLVPNLSAEDQALYGELAAFAAGPVPAEAPVPSRASPAAGWGRSPVCATGLSRGHSPGCDLAINWAALTAAGSPQPGEAVLLLAHGGTGGTWGAAVVVG